MRAVVVGGNAEQVNQARRILLSEGVACEAADATGYQRLQDSLAAVQPDVVLVFCNAGSGEGPAAVETAHHLVTGTVLAAGQPDAALMREVLRAGAGQYLNADNLRHELIAALAAIESARTGASKRGRIISVFSPINGAGVTTIALNLAVSLAKARANTQGTVALLDLTPPPSDLSLLLDLNPKHTLADVLHHQDRLDRRLVAGAMTVHESGLYVLPQAGFTDELRMPPFNINAPIVRQIFVLLRTSFDVAVIDLGHALCDVQFEAFRLSNVVLLPVVADVPGLRRVRWALDTAESLGISRDRFQIVVNRHGAKNQVPPAKVEEALHTTIATTIADRGPALAAARNEGVPAIEISGPVAAAFTSLVKFLQLNETGAHA
jgi:pilus assembly protein CpaE